MDKSEWLEFDDGNDNMIFRVEGDGGIEIKSWNGKEAPEDTNSNEYSDFIFGSMVVTAKIINEFDKAGIINK